MLSDSRAFKLVKIRLDAFFKMLQILFGEENMLLPLMVFSKIRGSSFCLVQRMLELMPVAFPQGT